MNKLDGNSMNIINENIEKIKEIFPEVFSENKIDFEKLQEELGEFIDNKKERYSFSWNGKNEAKKISLTPSLGTLRPCIEESKNFDRTENLYIEGDNLEVLKLLQKSYHKKIKMIYIDPPYNTGKDFVYKDNFKDNVKNYLEVTGQVDSEGNKLSTNSDTSGRYHSDWLNMMYPRLKLARNVLKDDGAIFISIDENEVYNLRNLSNQIFGEDNFVTEIIWQKNFAPKNDAKYFSSNHEHCLVYAKNKNLFSRNLIPRTEENNKGYTNQDNDERGLWSSGTMLATTYSEKYTFGILKPNGDTAYPPSGRCWRYSESKIKELKQDNRIWFGKDGSNVPRIKRFLTEVPDGIVPMTLWQHSEVGNTQSATNDLKKIFDNKQLFQFSKSIDYIKKMIIIGSNEDDIILDFFSGSATTAHTVLKLNSKSGKRKFIMVQLPEEINSKDEAYKEGYKNICEIGKERIRRAGEKILEDNKDKDLSDLDIGFKVLKLDSSNIKTWDSDYENLEQNLLDSVDNIKEDRTNEDLLYEILLKYGLDLTLPIEELNINNKKVFSIGFGALIVCLDNDIDTNTVEKIAELKGQYEEDYGLEDMKVVFKDNGFKDAIVKTNSLQILKQHNINEVVSI